jgi:hypothetical protein
MFRIKYLLVDNNLQQLFNVSLYSTTIVIYEQPLRCAVKLNKSYNAYDLFSYFMFIKDNKC